jgi:hypothetical protein
MSASAGVHQSRQETDQLERRASQRSINVSERMTLFPGAPVITEDILGGEELAYTICYAMTTAHQQKWKEKGIGAFSSAPLKTLLKHFQVL